MHPSSIDAGADTSPFRILTVCTGNICRSPMAERLLQAGLDEQFPNQFVVRSAGTGALVGNPIDPKVAGYIREAGGNSEGFFARQLTPQLLRDQDLVLALSREHRGKIVEMSPSLLRKAFTIREFARLVPLLTLDQDWQGKHRWKAATGLALRARSIDPALCADDDVVDPFRQKDEVYQRMFDALRPSITTLIRLSQRL